MGDPFDAPWLITFIFSKTSFHPPSALRYPLFAMLLEVKGLRSFSLAELSATSL